MKGGVHIKKKSCTKEFLKQGCETQNWGAEGETDQTLNET